MLLSFYGCFFSTLLSAVLWTGEVWEFLSFTERHPSILYNIVLFGMTSALGQVGGWMKELMWLVWLCKVIGNIPLCCIVRETVL